MSVLSAGTRVVVIAAAIGLGYFAIHFISAPVCEAACGRDGEQQTLQVVLWAALALALAVGRSHLR